MSNCPTKDPYVPFYPCEPIRSVKALSVALGIPELRLRRIADVANRHYRVADTIEKPDGTKRQTFDAYPRLKEIHTRIKERILARVEFPQYLNGSLKGRSTRKNAEAHVGAKISISEDIAQFFPSITESIVYAMWSGLFRFSGEVASLLTLLTIKDGEVPQGAVTSSYLANLALWLHEPALVRKFEGQGFIYTRYVDDITVSSSRRLTVAEQTAIVSAIYGMLIRFGLRPKRAKHEVQTARRRMATTKLLNNAKVSQPKEKRQAVRAAVFQLEQRAAFGERDKGLAKELARVSCRVGMLATLHSGEATLLKARLKTLRRSLEPVTPQRAAGKGQDGPDTSNLVTLDELIAQDGPDY